MHVASSAISLNVADPTASAAFVEKHFGWEVALSGDGFVSLRREDVGYNLIFLQVGLESFRPRSHAAAARNGLIIAWVVEDLDGEFARLKREGAHVVTPPQTEPWGERFCQFCDPNEVLFQLVEWV